MMQSALMHRAIISRAAHYGAACINARSPMHYRVLKRLPLSLIKVEYRVWRRGRLAVRLFAVALGGQADRRGCTCAA